MPLFPLISNTLIPKYPLSSNTPLISNTPYSNLKYPLFSNTVFNLKYPLSQIPFNPKIPH